MVRVGAIMIKDFESWGKIKEVTNNKCNRITFKERDVLWCRLGANIGDEQDGKGNNFTRPVLILKKFNKRIFVGLPFSSKIKEENRFYYKFVFKGQDQSVIISQIRLLDSKRLYHKLGAITEADFEKIKEKTKKLMF
jgi:mRNA interferase MazF